MKLIQISDQSKMYKDTNSAWYNVDNGDTYFSVQNNTRFYTGTLMNLIHWLGELLTDNFCFYTNREFYSKERTRMQEQLRQYDDDLRLTRSTLRKEMDWKEKMEKNYQTVLREKREYLSQYVL